MRRTSPIFSADGGRRDSVADSVTGFQQGHCLLWRSNMMAMRFMVDRRQFIGAAAIAVVGTARAAVPLRAQTQDVPPTSFRVLRRGVGVFTGPGGTIGWLSTPDG